MRYSVTENQKECCGCFACASVCPVGAISMKPDKEGCIYPAIDTDKCIECGLCEKTCTINKPITKFCGGGYTSNNQIAYALRYIDKNQRDMSASGGAFSAIAESCFDIHPKCVVFGAAWVGNNKVQHIAVEKKADLYLLRKSKYVQSEIGDAYNKCKNYLNDDFFVVFSGTPCQIAGLKSYLGKEYDSLLTIDIVCHGTPPAWVLESYVDSVEKQYGQKVKSITFRYKKKDLFGTTQSKNILIELDNRKIVQSARTNYYLRGFQLALFYRSICYDCKYATHQRVSDITLGDYWSIQDIAPEMIDSSGVSCVLVNSENGNSVFESLMTQSANTLEIKETSIDFLYKHNGLLCTPIKKHRQRDRFMELLQHTDFCEAIDLTLGKRNMVKNFVLDVMPYKFYYSLKRLLTKK